MYLKKEKKFDLTIQSHLFQMYYRPYLKNKEERMAEIHVFCNSNPFNRVNLIVSHVARSCAEFSVRLDDFVDSFEEIFFSCHLSTSTNGKHAGFCTYRTNFGTF